MKWAAAFLLFSVSGSAIAQMVETHITATNGVIVDKNADDFAGRFEYNAPTIKFDVVSGRGSGIALVAKTRRNGALNKLNVQGFIIYSGEWQYFNSAVFRGGDPVDYTRTGGDVGSCRYGCTLTENYVINLTPAEIQKHAENGIVAVQLRAAKTGATAIIPIPVSYIDAVNEVAK